MPYQYNAQVNRVIDGDTICLDVDLGFNLWLRDQHFRLVGLNAREKSEPGGVEAKANLQQVLPDGSEVVISSIKVDKFGGRFDAVVMLADGSDLAEKLIVNGWASRWSGSGARPVPPWPRKPPPWA